MPLNTFTQTLGITAQSDLSAAASKFITAIKDFMIDVHDNPDESLMPQNEEKLKTLYTGFFQFSKQWAKGQKELYLGKKDHKEAERLKVKAVDAFTKGEEAIIEYAICYMQLMQASGYVVQELKKYKKPQVGERINWNTSDEKTIHKYYAEAERMIERIAYLKEALAIIAPIEKKLGNLENALRKAVGGSNVEAEMRAIRSSMRKNDLPLTRKKIDNIGGKKSGFLGGESASVKNAKKIALDCLADVETHAEAITDMEDKLYLSQAEIEAAIETLKQDIAKKHGFIHKYCQPYMENQIKRIAHLRDKMLIIGSIDGLITLYSKLIRGVAQPLQDIKEIRTYEGEVLEKIIYLVSGQFQEIKKIESRNEDMMKEFKFSLKAFENVFTKDFSA